jgi:hypothetical protein
MIIKLYTAVTNLNVQGNLISHCGRDKNIKYILDWLMYLNLMSFLHLTFNFNYPKSYNPCVKFLKLKRSKQILNEKFHCILFREWKKVQHYNHQKKLSIFHRLRVLRTNRITSVSSAEGCGGDNMFKTFAHLSSIPAYRCRRLGSNPVTTRFS